MKTNRTNHKPVVIFILLTYLLSWGLMGLFIAQFRGWISVPLTFEPFLILGSWFPNIAAFLVIAFVLKQKGGVKQLLKGWLKFKVPAFWYLVAFSPVVFAVISMFIYKLLYGVNPVSEIVFDPISMLALIIISTVTGATGEELGWRGFALPRLQVRMNALNASMVLGVIWTLWHLPLWFAGLGYENIPFGAYVILVMSYTVLITWACNNSRGSMVIVTIFHLMMNVAMNILEIKAYFVYAILVLAITVVVVFLYRPSKLSKTAELPIEMETGDWKA